ncbi:MAG: diphthamide synthesis protein [Candidatus Nanoarchaeia archaeon]
MDYDLELEKVVKEIRRVDAKSICVQLPDNLKPNATEIASFIESRTGANVLIWADTCFGACDIPKIDADMLIQWGHTSFGF